MCKLTSNNVPYKKQNKTKQNKNKNKEMPRSERKDKTRI